MHDGAVMRILRRHQRQHFVQDIILEGAMPADALGRVMVEGIEGLGRQSLDAIELEMARLELVGKASD